MEIVKYNIEKIMAEIEYKYIQKYSDNQLNSLFNYWNVFDEKEKEIQELKRLSLDPPIYHTITNFQFPPWQN